MPVVIHAYAVMTVISESMYYWGFCWVLGALNEYYLNVAPRILVHASVSIKPQ